MPHFGNEEWMSDFGFLLDSLNDLNMELKRKEEFMQSFYDKIQGF